MAEPIQIEVEFTGAAEAARAADTVSGRLDNLSNRTESAARSAENLAARQTAAAVSSLQFAQRMTAASNAVQGVVSALGIEGQAAGLIGKITQTSTAMAQLGESFGPQGELVGSIVGAAIPAIAAVVEAINEVDERNQEWQEQLRGIEEGQRRAAEATRESAEAFREQALSVAEAGNRMREFIESLSGTGLQRQSQDASAQITELSDQLANVNDQMEQLRGRGGAAAAAALFDLQDQAEGLTRRISSLTEQVESLSQASAPAPRSRGGGGGRARAEEERAPSGPSEAERMYAETLAEENAYLQQQADLEEYLSDLRQREITEIDGREERAKKQHDAEMERLEERQDRLNEVQARQREAHEQQVEEYKGLMGVVVGGLNDALQSIISGQKTAGEAFEGLLASFLKYISEQAILKAIFEYAEAIASFASYKIDQGVQHLAAGAAYTAVAVAAGAGSVALSAPSGATPSDQKPAGPEAGAAGEGRGGGDVVINWNSPVVTAGTRAELGRDMASMIRAGSQRFGTV